MYTSPISERTFLNNWLSPFIFAISSLCAAPAAWGDVSTTDPDVTAKVEEALLFDPAVPFDPIDVRTRNGVVSLSGTVSNLLAKERATRIAETVRGVRSVINQIKVEPTASLSRNQLRKAIEKALFYDAATEAYEIKVDVEHAGEAILSGSVDSWAEHELAETVAKSVNGVTKVINDIVVIAKYQRSNTEIQSEIENRLHWDTLVNDARINVTVDAGKVFLSGVVGSAAEKRRAEWRSQVTAVKAVDSTALKVQQWSRDEELRKRKYVKRSDLQIREAVQDTLLYDPRVNAFNFEVRVKNGRVTLRGVVDNIKAKKAAQRDARNTVGVIGVRSLIKVRPVTQFSADTIAENVRGALLRNPYTENHGINVRVKDQVVYLEGKVDSYFEKAEAEDVAFRAAGVIDVRNDLTVSHPKTLTSNPYVYKWSMYDFPWEEGLTVTRTKSDRQIAQDIEDELMWNPFIDSEDISVSVDNGVVTLSGTVDSWGEYNTAQENAIAGGAVDVVNKLEVK